MIAPRHPRGAGTTLTLHFSPGSSSMATHIALHEMGVVFEARPTLLYQNAHRSPEYLAINAEAKVPILLIDGRPLTEGAATLWYLARRYPGAGLLPQQGDIVQRTLEIEAAIGYNLSGPREAQGWSEPEQP